MSDLARPDVPRPVELSGLLVQPIAQRIADWTESGKVEEEALDALTTEARAWVDHSIASTDWAALDDVEGLVELASIQLGGETGLVEWADAIAHDLLETEPIADIVERAGRLTEDGPGFAASQSSDHLLRWVRWQYEGGGARFSIRLDGMGAASTALKSLVGACLARIAGAGDPRTFDTRFEGVDGDELAVFGELEDDRLSPDESSRLHRAALIP